MICKLSKILLPMLITSLTLSVQAVAKDSTAIGDPGDGAGKLSKGSKDKDSKDSKDSKDTKDAKDSGGDAKKSKDKDDSAPVKGKKKKGDSGGGRKTKSYEMMGGAVFQDGAMGVAGNFGMYSTAKNIMEIGGIYGFGTTKYMEGHGQYKHFMGKSLYMLGGLGGGMMSITHNQHVYDGYESWTESGIVVRFFGGGGYMMRLGKTWTLSVEGNAGYRMAFSTSNNVPIDNKTGQPVTTVTSGLSGVSYGVGGFLGMAF